eukprot:2655915-Karenia_brevis.AAC.1
MLLPPALKSVVRNFVFPSWISNPARRASIKRSCSMCDAWYFVDAKSRMSSAKRKFVTLSLRTGSTIMPQRFSCHFCFKSLMICSNSELNKAGDSGSPCFVPR